MYSQGKPDFNEIQAALLASNKASNKASNNTNTNNFTRAANRSDLESTELTSLLQAQISQLYMSRSIKLGN
jgi:phytoene/squalene synthetase